MECRGRSLRYLLHLPVQRIPDYKTFLDVRYFLLFFNLHANNIKLIQEIVSNTWEEHVDMSNLQQAATSIAPLAAYVTDSQADVQQIMHLLKIQKRIHGDIDVCISGCLGAVILDIIFMTLPFIY